MQCEPPIPTFLPLLVFLFMDILITSNSNNKEHHNSTVHTIQWSQFNQSALLRRTLLGVEGAGRPRKAMVGRGPESHVELRRLDRVAPFIILGPELSQV